MMPGNNEKKSTFQIKTSKTEEINSPDQVSLFYLGGKQSLDLSMFAIFYSIAILSLESQYSIRDCTSCSSLSILPCFPFPHCGIRKFQRTEAEISKRRKLQLISCINKTCSFS